MEKLSMSLQVYTEKDWIKRMYRKSESIRTENVAKTSLRMFELFCLYDGLNKDELIKEYVKLFNQTKPDVRSICLSLDKFVQYLDQEHDPLPGIFWLITKDEIKDVKERMGLIPLPVGQTKLSSEDSVGKK